MNTMTTTPTATPRTNAALEWVRPAGNDSGPPNEQYVSAEVARTLETELDAAKAECERLRKAGTDTWGELREQIHAKNAELARLRAENEQLKADVTRETTVCDTACMEAQRLRAEVKRLTKQNRDEESWWKEKHDYQARAERAEEQLALKNSQCEHAERAAAGALAERDALAKDKARLDWLLQDAIVRYAEIYHDRAAIDAAMKGTT